MEKFQPVHIGENEKVCFEFEGNIVGVAEQPLDKGILGATQGPKHLSQQKPGIEPRLYSTTESIAS